MHGFFLPGRPIRPIGRELTKCRSRTRNHQCLNADRGPQMRGRFAPRDVPFSPEAVEAFERFRQFQHSFGQLGWPRARAVGQESCVCCDSQERFHISPGRWRAALNRSGLSWSSLKPLYGSWSSGCLHARRGDPMATRNCFCVSYGQTDLETIV
jgi:hypothetical protein